MADGDSTDAGGVSPQVVENENVLELADGRIVYRCAAGESRAIVNGSPPMDVTNVELTSVWAISAPMVPRGVASRVVV
jgi:hypothetical protein